MPFALFLPSILAAGLFVLLPALPGLPAARADSLPLPRFVSLKAAEVNMRTGPGKRYPIDWVYKRRALPVEITAVFANWRRVRDSQGTMGWMHHSLLSGRRTALVAEKERIFRRAPQADAAAVFRAAPGVLVAIISCDGAWCHVERDETKAWARQDGLWGVYPGEVIE